MNKIRPKLFLFASKNLFSLYSCLTFCLNERKDTKKVRFSQQKNGQIFSCLSVVVRQEPYFCD